MLPTLLPSSPSPPPDLRSGVPLTNKRRDFFRPEQWPLPCQTPHCLSHGKGQALPDSSMPPVCAGERERERLERGGGTVSTGVHLWSGLYSWTFRPYITKGETWGGKATRAMTSRPWEPACRRTRMSNLAAWRRGGGEPWEETVWSVAMGGSLSLNRRGSVSSQRKKSSM